MNELMIYALSVVAAVVLSASCGLRVTVPFLVVGLAASKGVVHLHHGWAWLSNTWVLVILGVAVVIEISAYLVPLVDNVVDIIAVPAATIASVVMATAILPDGIPHGLNTILLALSAAAGGGVAFSTAKIRAMSSLGTGGLANPLVATSETIGAVLIPLLVLFAGSLVLASVLLAAIVIAVHRARNRSARAVRAET